MVSALQHLLAASATLLFTITLSTSSIIYSHTQCASNTLEPCKQHPSFSDSIFCENISDIHIFVRVLRCGSRSHMQEVYLEKSSLDYLPLYIIDFCGFFFLNVKSVVLSQKLLDGNVLVRLQQLHLDDVVFGNPLWSWRPLAVLEKLLKFSVANMKVAHLDGSLVDHLIWKLQSFAMTSTNTTSLADDVFGKFTELEYVSVQDNGISELKRSMFAVPAKIKFFYFRKNRISSLPGDLFHDMPNLQSIALQGNLISEIHISIFRGVWDKLSVLLLEGNPLKCDCKMLWLLKKHRMEIFTGSCFAPKHNYGKHLKDLEIQDFHCFETESHTRNNLLLSNT